jgi:hypothetical protein
MELQCIIVQTGIDIRDGHFFVLHAVGIVCSFFHHGQSSGVFILPSLL